MNIRGWLQKRDTEKAIALIEQMVAVGIRPDVVTFTTFIRSYCKEKDMDTAMDVLRAMRRNRIKADAWTYNTMMQG